VIHVVSIKEFSRELVCGRPFRLTCTCGWQTACADEYEAEQTKSKHLERTGEQN